MPKILAAILLLLSCNALGQRQWKPPKLYDEYNHTKQAIELPNPDTLKEQIVIFNPEGFAQRISVYHIIPEYIIEEIPINFNDMVISKYKKSPAKDFYLYLNYKRVKESDILKPPVSFLFNQSP